MVLIVLFFTIGGVHADETCVSLQTTQIFPEDNIWNVPVDKLPIDPKSEEYIDTIGSSSPLKRAFSIPYNVVDQTQQKSKVAFTYAGQSDNVLYPIPSPVLIEGGTSPETCAGDCHVLIVDEDTQTLYELYDLGGKFPNGTWQAGSGAVFSMGSNTLRPDGWTSADAAGLAMLPGIIRYDEIQAGKITHAIRFSTRQTRNAYIWPARHSASGITDPAYPPMGQRFRLNASFDTTKYPTQARIILEACKKYGMILADHGPEAWLLYGTPDPRWDYTALLTLQQVKGSDIEAVDESMLMLNEDSGQALNPVVSPSVIVTAPNGGQTWYRGSTHTITWASIGNPGTSVKIELLKAGSVVQTIASTTPNSGSYTSWTIPTGLVPGSDYKIRITSTSNTAINDMSDKTFTITSQMIVTSPNGGETLVRGTPTTISWTSHAAGTDVRIELLKAGVRVMDVTSWTKTNPYSWTVPKNLAPGSDYKIRISNLYNASVVNDTSDSTFTVTDKMLVTSPNGGETWLRGSKPSITWTSYEAGTSVKIELLKAGSVVQTIASTTPNSGSYTSWTVPTGLKPGSDYKIRISSTGTTTINDTSNSFFTISDKMLVTSPNGGETLIRGSKPSISWTSYGAGTAVKIELLKAGVRVLNVTTYTTSNPYSWTVPTSLTPGSDYKIRISNLYNASVVNDTSDSTFTITDKMLVTSPNGGETLVRGTPATISWTSYGAGTDVRIELLKAGVRVLNVTSWTKTNPYTWTVPASLAPGSDYKIRISNQYNASVVNDTSDRDFTIRLP